MAQTSRWGSLLLVTLSLPFLGFGGFMGYETLTTLTDWHDSQQWMEVPARIEQIELEKHRGKKGRSSYRVNCTYTYAFEGQEYRGDRVGFSSGSDNIGSWHRTTYARLKSVYDDGEAATCYVDPIKPDCAVLDRQLRVELLTFMMIFYTVFPTVGIGMFLGGLFSNSRSGDNRNLIANYPTQPWMWRRPWAEGHIPSGTKTLSIIVGVVAIVWNILSAPVVMIVLPEAVITQGQTWAWILLIFPLIGIGLIAWALYALMRHLKFGRSYLRLRTLPGQIGGQFAGELVLSGDLTGLEAAKVSLHCIHSVTTRRGKHSHTTHTTLWEQEANCAATPSFEGTELIMPVSFDIPLQALPTNTAESNNRIDWKLRAAAEVPGVNLKLEFEVPVFQINPQT